MKMPSNKTSWCPGLCWSIVWLLIWFLAWPMAFVLAIVEVFIIPFCVCFEKAKTACEFIDRIYKKFAGILKVLPIHDFDISPIEFVPSEEVANNENNISSIKPSILENII
ncbi:unnamed protein product [Schistosoma guineensis]|nr:unnamed protein product [Schistosoma guineensis]